MKETNSNATILLSSIPETFCGAVNVTLGIPVLLAGITDHSVKQIVAGATLVTGGTVAIVHAATSSLTKILAKGTAATKATLAKNDKDAKNLFATVK